MCKFFEILRNLNVEYYVNFVITREFSSLALFLARSECRERERVNKDYAASDSFSKQ